MKFALIGAALVATAALASAASAAPRVIGDPGRCAQFYPNANCQDLGPGNPYTGSGYRTGGASWENGYARMGHRTWRHRHHRMMHRH